MRKLKVIVVGAGRMGELHAKNLRKLYEKVEIVGIVDTNLNKARKLASELNTFPFTDIAYAIKSQKPDAAIIAVTTQYHFPLIKEAAENNVNIFVEKPMGLNTEENMEIVKLVSKSGIKLQVGFHRLYEESYVRAKDLIERNKIGKIISINFINRDLPSYLPYEPYPAGIIDDMAIHSISLMVWIAGFDSMKIYTSGLATDKMPKEYKDAKDFDAIMLNIKYDKGPLVGIEVNRNSKYGYDERMEVVGDNGLIKVENRVDYQTYIYTDDYLIHPSYQWPNLSSTIAYEREIEAFINSVIKDDKPFPDHIFGLYVGEISDSAKKSLLGGKVEEIETKNHVIFQKR